MFIEPKSFFGIFSNSKWPPFSKWTPFHYKLTQNNCFFIVLLTTEPDMNYYYVSNHLWYISNSKSTMKQ